MGSCVRAWSYFQKLLLYFGGWFRQTQKDIFDNVPIDSYCKIRLYCSFHLSLLIFIYSMMGLLTWREVSVRYLILRWLPRPMGLLFVFGIGLQEYIKSTLFLFKTNYTIGRLQDGKYCTKILWCENLTWKINMKKSA